MIATVCKRYKFSAAHHLPGHPSPCQSNHGHTFFLDVYARGEVQTEGREKGMVVDYSRLSTAWDEIEGFFDHSDLNETVAYPTTEHVAAFVLAELRDRVPEVFKVRLWEGPGQFAEVEFED